MNAPAVCAPLKALAAASLVPAALLPITLAGYALSRLSRNAIAASPWLRLLVLVPLTLRWGRPAGLALWHLPRPRPRCARRADTADS